MHGARIVIDRKPPGCRCGVGRAIENKNKIGRKKPIRLGMESEHLTAADALRNWLLMLRHDFKFRETRASRLEARMVKDAHGIWHVCEPRRGWERLLRQRALEVILVPGVTETKLQPKWSTWRGALEQRGDVVPDYHRAGKRSALPHGRASTAVIPSRGFVVCDFGVILSGYCSDRTRTVYVGVR